MSIDLLPFLSFAVFHVLKCDEKKLEQFVCLYGLFSPSMTSFKIYVTLPMFIISLGLGKEPAFLFIFSNISYPFCHPRRYLFLNIIDDR